MAPHLRGGDKLQKWQTVSMTNLIVSWACQRKQNQSEALWSVVHVWLVEKKNRELNQT